MRIADGFRENFQDGGLRILPPARINTILHEMIDSNLVVDIAPVATLRHLFELDLSANPVAHIGALGGVEGLARLNLPATSVTKFDPLEQLAAPEIIDLTRTRLTCQQYAVIASSLGAKSLRHDLGCDWT